MLVCGIDFEATDKEAKTARITEVGAALFDTDDNWRVVDRFDMFVWDPGYPKQTEEVIQVTGITDEMLKEKGVSFPYMLKQLIEFAKGAVGFIAHNRDYDQTLLKCEIQRNLLQGLPIGYQTLLERPWLCSIADLKSNQGRKCLKLSHLALDYGVPVDPAELHRASADVELMGKMLAKAGAMFEQMLAYMQTPNIVVRIKIPAPWEDNGKGKEYAQKNGFSWERPRGSDKTFAKKWVKQIKANELEALQAGSLYDIKQLEE